MSSKEQLSYTDGTPAMKIVTKRLDGAGNRTSEVYPDAGGGAGGGGGGTGARSLVNNYNAISQLTSTTDGTNTLASYAMTRVRRLPQ